MREQLLEDIIAYQPYNEQEANDKVELIKLIKNTPDIFTRENRQYHLTSSAWVVSKDRKKILMVYHNIYDSWSWMGGHADGDEDLLKVAIKEVKEESGVTYVKCLSPQIFSLEILTVDGHIKREKYVPSHLHLNLAYLLEADENETLKIKPDENKGVSWFPLEEVIEASNEKWFKEHIYKKLNAKLLDFIKKEKAN